MQIYFTHIFLEYNYIYLILFFFLRSTVLLERDFEKDDIVEMQKPLRAIKFFI